MTLKESRDDIIRAIDRLSKQNYKLNESGTSFIRYDGDLFEVKDVTKRTSGLTNLQFILYYVINHAPAESN
jgi:hypothetical protein